MEMEQYLIDIDGKREVREYPVNTLYSDILDEVADELYVKYGGIGCRPIDITVWVILEDGKAYDPERERVYVAN